MNLFNNFFFIALPYIALIIFLIGTINNYRVSKFKISSISSQFLEGRHLFWGSVPFHWGLLFLFFGHLLAFLIPEAVIAWNSQPVRLLILEITAFIFGLSMLVGMVNLVIRRWSHPRIRAFTTKMDVIVEVLILSQVVLGLWIAYEYRWGSSWFAATLTPYLWSIFKLNPSIDAVSAMPYLDKISHHRHLPDCIIISFFKAYACPGSANRLSMATIPESYLVLEQKNSARS